MISSKASKDCFPYDGYDQRFPPDNNEELDWQAMGPGAQGLYAITNVRERLLTVLSAQLGPMGVDEDEAIRDFPRSCRHLWPCCKGEECAVLALPREALPLDCDGKVKVIRACVVDGRVFDASLNVVLQKGWRAHQSSEKQWAVPECLWEEVTPSSGNLLIPE